MFYPLLRPLLFGLEPEAAHHLALGGLDRAAGLGYRQRVMDSPRTVMGLHFTNPVGLAAGLDKDAEHLAGLSALGFGFIEVGTTTPLPQPGNPAPRLFRLPRVQALINRMGFNSKGVDYLLGQLEQTRFDGVLGINIGKNRDTPLERAADDYLVCLRKVYTQAGYITVNISSPNTPGLRTLQYGEALATLLAPLKAEQTRLAEAYGRYVPLVVKIGPDLEPGEIPLVAKALLHHHIDGAIATNTTAARPGVEGLPHAQEAGGLSGGPLFEASTRVLEQLCQALEGRGPVIAAGGISSGEQARAKLAAGASLVQLYSGLIYRGPALVKEVAAALAR